MGLKTLTQRFSKKLNVTLLLWALAIFWWLCTKDEK